MKRKGNNGKFVVASCHDGSDWCIRDATAEDTTDEIWHIHAEALAEMLELVRTDNKNLPANYTPTKGFDFSSFTLKGKRNEIYTRNRNQ